MHYIKLRKDLSYGLAPLLTLLGLIFFCYFPNAIAFYFKGFWIAAFSAFILFATPLGRHRLAHNENDIVTKLPTAQWILTIFLFQLSLFGVFYGITTVVGTALPVNTTPHPYLFSQSLQSELLHFGLFPWSLYAVITVGMGLTAYNQQHNAYFNNLFRPLIKTELHSVIGLITNVGSRRITLFGIGLTLTFLPILITSLLIAPEKHIAVGFQPVTLFLTLFLLFATFSEHIKRYQTRLFSRHIPTFLSLPIFGIVLALTLVILSTLIAGITPKQPQSTPEFMQNWIGYHWQTAWMIFSMMWWAALTPAVCAFLTRISRGYRIRQIVFTLLVLPMIMAGLLFYNVSFSLPEKLMSLLSVISFLIALPLLVNYQNLSCLIFSFFPKNGETKIRDHHPFFSKTIQLCIVGLYFYLVIGINGISMLIFVMNFSWLIAAFVACVTIMRNAQTLNTFLEKHL